MSLRKFITTLIAAAGIGVTQAAETVYKTAWVQDFEDADTYAAQFSVCSISNAILGTVDKAIESKYSGVYSQAERTIYNASKTSKFWRTYTNKVKGGYFSLFTIPTSVGLASARDYKVDFDTLVSHPVGSGAQNGTVVQGALGPIATFNAPPGGNTDNKSSTMTIYAQDDSTKSLGTVVSVNRGQDPADSKWAKYWIHVTVRGVDGDGIYLTVTQADGTVAVAEQKISETFDYVTEIFFRMNNSAGNYDGYCSLDDVAVSYPNSGSTFTWTGASWDGLWATPGNWLEGEEVPLSAPTAADDVIIPANVKIAVPQDFEYKSIVMGAGAKLYVLVSAVGDSFTIPEGLESTQITAAGPFAVTVEGNEMTVSERVASSFVWAGGATGAWGAALAWTVDGSRTLVAPLAADEAVFPADATVSFSANAEVGTLTIAAEATLTANGDGKELAGLRYFGTAEEKGGKLVLNRLNLKSYSMNSTVVDPVTSCSWYGDIEIAGGGYTNTIYCMSSDNKSTGKRLNIYGNLSGSGTVRFMGEGHHGSGVFDGRASTGLYGDNSSFTGVGIVNNNSASGRSSATFYSETAGGKAMWVLVDCLYTYDVNNLAGSIDSAATGSVFGFGAIQGSTVLSGTKEMTGKTVVLGSANIDFTTWLSFTSTTAERPANNATLKKVGSGTMTFGGVDKSPCWATNVLAGGTWKMDCRHALRTPKDGKGNYVDTTIIFAGGTVAFGGSFTNETGNVLDIAKYIRNSTSPIAVEVEPDADVAWENVVPSSNVAGLTKKGAGTLTLAADANQTLGYSGYTRVEAGKLVVPADTHYKWDITSPVALATAVEGATPTGYGVGTAQTNWVYGVNAWNDAAKTVDLTNLATIDLTSVKTIGKGEKFVIMTAKAFQINSEPMTKEQREAIAIELSDEVKEIAAAKGYALRIEGNNLVYGPKLGFVVVFQ